MGRRSFGWIRRLPSGRYQASFLSPGGTRHNAPQTFSAKGDASRWLAATETKIASGAWSDPNSAKVKLQDYAEDWLPQRTVRGKHLAPRTLQTYRHSLDKWILPTLGGLSLGAITPAVVRTWHAETLGQTGPTATRQAYALLRAILNTAVSDDVLSRNPCRITGAGQADSPERPLLDLETVFALIAEMPEYLRTFSEITFWAHLRVGEAVALKHMDVDLVAGTLRVQRQDVELKDRGPVETLPKMSSQRLVHLPDQAVQALRDHMALHPGGPSSYLFTRRDGSKLRALHVQNAVETARRKIGRPDLHTHDLRHAGLTLTAQLGATLAELQRRAGHSSAKAALGYQHAAMSRDRDLALKLSGLRLVPPLVEASPGAAEERPGVAGTQSAAEESSAS